MQISQGTLATSDQRSNTFEYTGHAIDANDKRIKVEIIVGDGITANSFPDEVGIGFGYDVTVRNYFDGLLNIDGDQVDSKRYEPLEESKSEYSHFTMDIRLRNSIDADDSTYMDLEIVRFNNGESAAEQHTFRIGSADALNQVGDRIFLFIRQNGVNTFFDNLAHSGCPFVGKFQANTALCISASSKLWLTLLGHTFLNILFS